MMVEKYLRKEGFWPVYKKGRAEASPGNPLTYLKHSFDHGGVWIKILSHRRFRIWWENCETPKEVDFNGLQDTIDSLTSPESSELDEMYQFFKE